MTSSIGVATHKILVKVVEDRHSPGALSFRLVSHSPDYLEQGDGDVGHAVYLPSIQVETLVRKAILSQAVHINLNMHILYNKRIECCSSVPHGSCT